MSRKKEDIKFHMLTIILKREKRILPFTEFRYEGEIKEEIS
jgi:hypothetical protein